MEIDTILQNHGLRKTGARVSVLNTFKEQSYALSHSDLEKVLQKTLIVLRSTEPFILFLEKGIIHKVIDDSESAKYALCVDDCTTGHHHDNHVHFKCTKCGHSECLNHVQIPHISLPKGYLVNNSNLLIEGVCNSCN